MSNLPARIRDNEKPPRESIHIGREIVSFFFQGLLLLAPFIITVYVIIALLQFLDTLIPIQIPGVSILIIVSSITAVGFLSKTFIFGPLFNYLEKIITRLPLAKIIYTSLQDLFQAFVSDKQKFDQPVLVMVNSTSGLKKMGFITQHDLEQFNLPDDVAVYFPHSYNFSGNLFIVPRENVTILKGVSSTEAMKFIVSGGVTKMEKGMVKTEDNNLRDGE